MFLLDPKHSEMNSPEDIRMNTPRRAGLTGSQEELDPFLYTHNTHTHTLITVSFLSCAKT